MSTPDNLRTNLLPCPFCGGDVDPAGWLGGDGTRGPECEGCGSTAPSMDVWNTRPLDESALYNALKELERLKAVASTPPPDSTALLCEYCGKGVLYPEFHNETLADGTVIEDMERYRCDACSGDPVYPPQARRNEKRFNMVRELASLRAQLAPAPSHKTPIYCFIHGIVDAVPQNPHRCAVCEEAAHSVAAAPRRVITPVFEVCNAYESGFGHGKEKDKLPNPYTEGGEMYEAYDIGYRQGEECHKPAAPSLDSTPPRFLHCVHNKPSYARCEQCEKESATGFMREEKSKSGALIAAPVDQWQPIETAPTARAVIFWIVGKTVDETYVNTNGNPIVSNTRPHRRFCCFGQWSSLSKATHWAEPGPLNPPTKGASTP